MIRWGVTAWLMGVAALMGPAVGAAAAGPRAALEPMPLADVLLPIEQPDAATVGGRLFNRRGLQIHDGQQIGAVIRHLAQQARVRPRRAVAGIPRISGVWERPGEPRLSEDGGELQADRYQRRQAELLAMDPLTVSVVDLPATLGGGLALLVGLGLVRWSRARRLAEGG